MRSVAYAAILVLAGCAAVPEPIPTTAPEDVAPQCIYMIDDLQEHPGEFTEFTFDFMVWSVRGKNVDGLTGAMYSESVRQWLTLDGSRAAGTQEVFPEGVEPVIFPIIGAGEEMVVLGWDRIDVETIRRYSAGYLGNGSVEGC